jgi:invasion protein IalB
MRKLIAVIAALLCALALSAGAALAEQHEAPTKKGAPGAPSKWGFNCPLHDL